MKEEERYHKRREEKGSHFFKIILPSCIQDRCLAIPKKFIRCFGKELSNVAVLKVPTSKEWIVDLRENEGQVWFQNGLHAFMEYYSICVGHFLVFRYDGNSRFSVVICDISASEIKYPCNANDLEKSNNKIGFPKSTNREEYSTKIIELFPRKQKKNESDGQKTYKKCTAVFPESHFSLRSIETKTVETTSDLRFCKRRKIISDSLKSQSSNPSCRAVEKKKQIEDNGKKRKSNVGNENYRTEKRVHEEVPFPVYKNPKHDLSNFICQSNGEPTMLTPQKFTSTWVDNKITHQMKGVEGKKKFDRRVHYLERQREFVNKRERGVFGSLDCDCPNNYGQTMPSPSCFKIAWSGSDDQHQMKNLAALLDLSSFSLHRCVHSNICAVDTHCTKQDTTEKRQAELVLEPRKAVLFQDKERPITEAGTFTSENPFCFVTMRPSYVGRKYSLSLPMWFAKMYLKERFQQVTLQISDGRIWQVQCYSDKHHFRLVKGWKAFVLENQLEKDDICIFELVDKEHGELKVAIFRVFKDPIPVKGVSCQSKNPSCSPLSLVRVEEKQNEDNGKKINLSGSEEKNAHEQIGDEEIHFMVDRNDGIDLAESDSQYTRVPLTPTFIRCVSSRVDKESWNLTNNVDSEQRSGIAARAFTSKNPYCEVTMRRSVGAKFTLNIPKHFADKYLKDVFQVVTLHLPNGGMWPVQNKAGDHREISKGWKAFVYFDHLKEDYVCIFELVDKKRIEMKVHIFPARPLQLAA